MKVSEVKKSTSKVQKNLERIESKLFEVVKEQLTPKNNPEGIYEDPLWSNYGVYETTGGPCLGVMGERFTPTQPRDAYNRILNMAAQHDLDLAQLSFHRYRGGCAYAFSLPLPSIKFKNAAGKVDVTQVRLEFTTSFDGSKSNIASANMLREVCTNGMVAWMPEVFLKRRNTANAANDIDTYYDDVDVFLEGLLEYTESLKKLNKIPVTEAQINKTIKTIFGLDTKKLAEMTTRSQNKLAQIQEAIQIEFERTGETAFGLLQGITYYTNHMKSRPKHSTVEDDVRFGGAYSINARAQEEMFKLIK